MASAVGFLRVLVGATPEMAAMRKEVAAAGKQTVDNVKQFRAIQAQAVGASLLGFAAVGVGLLKAAQSAIAFEDSFAGIRKTVEASEDQFKRLADQVLELSTIIPVSADELNRIGELGGQLGIAVENLPDFIKTVSTLATTTNLTVDNAALGLARLDAIAQTNGETFENMASVIVELGNNFAATESEIMTTVLRIAQAAAQVGATTQDALAFAAALQAIGVPAQAGGTAVARVFQAINEAVITGGKSLEQFGNIAEASGRVTADTFSEAFGEDPTMAVVAFIEGLNELNKQGVNIIGFLDELDLKQRRTMLAILGLSEAEGVLADAVDTARVAFEENNAALEEAVKRYTTTASQIQLTANAFRELGTTIGQNTLNPIRGFLDILQETILGITESESAMFVLKTTFLSMVSAIVAVTLATGGLVTAFNFLAAHPIVAALSAIAAVGVTLAGVMANSAGEVEQVSRAFKAFEQDGKVTAGTIQAVIDTTREYQKVLEGLSIEDQVMFENKITEGLAGTPAERSAFLQDLQDMVAVQDELIAQGHEAGDQTAVITAAVEKSEILEVIEIVEEMNAAITKNEKIEKERLRQDAMKALGIEKLADKYTRLREEQEREIENYIKSRGAVQKYNEEQQKLKDEMAGLESLFDRVNTSVKETTDTFVASFQALPDAVIMSADEMVENFRTRFLLAEIFKAQIEELKRLGMDDLAFFFSQLGPEAAPNLANLLASPEALAELEAGLEQQEITAVEELKKNTEKITAVIGEEFVEAGKESGIAYVEGLVGGFKAGAPEAEGEFRKKIEGIARIAEIIFDTGSPSKRTQRLGRFIMLGFVKGIQEGYPTLEREFSGKMIDLAQLVETSVSQAVSSVRGAFGSQFGAVSSSRDITRQTRDLNKLIEEQTRLLKGNTAAQTKAIAEAEDRVAFLELAVKEGTVPFYELQIAEEELAQVRSENANQLIDVQERITQAQERLAQSQFNLGADAFGLLQAGPEAVEQFKTFGKVLGIDESIINRVVGKTEQLASTIGTDFSKAVNDVAKDYFDFNLKIEQEKITLNLDTSQATMTLQEWVKWYTGQINNLPNPTLPPVTPGGGGGGGFFKYMAKGGRIPMYANGGRHMSGYGLVGEYGPELIRAIPGGGVDITPLGNTGNSSITVQNLNVNVTGVPSDSMGARKAAIAIQKELAKLDREGLIGNGLRGR